MNKSTFSTFLGNEKYLLISGILIISVVFIPYLYWGQDSRVQIFDNMDSNITWVKMVLEEGGIFLSPGATVHPIMNGIPHSSVYAMYDISLVWFELFGMFWGYVFNKYLMAIIGFFGLYYLLKKYFLPKDTPLYISVGVSVLFALLPFWSFTAGVSGIPIALLAFFNIRRKDLRFINWFLLFVYAFYSSLVLTGFFVLLLVSGIFIYDFVKDKTINKYLLLAIVYTSVLYIVSHLPLFYSFLFDTGYISHRAEFYNYGYNLKGIKDTILNIYTGDIYTHAPSLQKYMLIPIMAVLCLMIYRRKISKPFLFIFLFIVLSSIFVGFHRWQHIIWITNDLNKILPLDITRITWLYPVCWYILFGMALVYIYKESGWGKYLVPVVLVFQFIVILYFQPYFKFQFNTEYGKFYAEEQFSDIKNFIGKDPSTYKVISLWLHPAISQYNGFYTLDGFSANYPLSYKHQFRKIIEKELAKTANPSFDVWGSRCYAFSAECGYLDLQFDFKGPKVQHLDYNYDILKEMGGEYIISGVEINTDNNPRLELLKIFDNYKTSHWTIYLYKVN